MPSPIRAVSLDLTGTLLFPKPSFGSRFAAALRRRGLEADSAAIERRIPRSMRAARAGKPYPDNDDAERDFLRDIVRGALAEDCPPDAFDAVFAELARELSCGDGWRAAPDAFAALSALRFLGLRVVVLSNGGRSMRRVLDDLGLAPLIDAILLSAETGTPKPDKRAFAAAVRAAGCRPGELLHVGDSPDEDATGALSAGLRACLLSQDPDAVAVPGAHRAANLAGVVDLVRGEAVAGLERRTFDRGVRNLVADLRALPEDFSRSQERPLASTTGIADLLRRAADGDASALKGVSDLARGAIGAEETGMDARGTLLDTWSTLISPRLRDKCFPVDIERDALVVLCTSTVARNELKFVERALIAAVRRLPGCSGVNRVVVRL